MTMKLNLTKQLRVQIRTQLAALIFELLDGDIDFPEQFATTLESIAAMVREQNQQRPPF